MIYQFINALMLVFGSILGEFIASKIFGIPKLKLLYLLEIVIFVLLTIVVLNNLIWFPPHFYMIILLLVGIYASTASRAISTLCGFFARFLIQRKKEELRPILRNLSRLLKERGMGRREIEDILISAGFRPKEVRRIVHASFSSSSSARTS